MPFSIDTNIPIKKGQSLAIQPLDEHGQPAEMGWIGYTFAPDGGGQREQTLHPALPPDLAADIGRLVCYWSCLDGVITEMTSLLTAHTGNVEPVRREFAPKLRRFKEEFRAAFSECQDLIDYFEKEIIAPINRVKLLRDDLNHAQIMGWATNKGACLRFVSDTYGRKTKRLFFKEDIQKAVSDTARAAGRLNQLATAPDDVPVSSPSKLALRRVLNEDRWHRAIEKALRLPQQERPR